jgi:hypothetical protein
MVGKIFEAEIAGAKRLLLKRFLMAAQIILLPINLLTVGFMTSSGICNVRGGDQYMQSAAVRRTGDNTTADAILETATKTNNLCNTYEGVSDPPSIAAIIRLQLKSPTPRSMRIFLEPSSLSP